MPKRSKSSSHASQDVTRSRRFLKTIQEYNAAVKRDVPFNPNIKDGRGTVGLAIDNRTGRTRSKSRRSRPIRSDLRHHVHVRRVEDRLPRPTCSTSEDGRCPASMRRASWSAVLFYFNYPGSAGLMAGSVFGRIAGREAGSFAMQQR